MSARPQVTITLGRSGQVVKRSGTVSDISHSDHVPSSGGKRSIKERLGNNADDSYSYGSHYKSKRQRTQDRRSLSDDDLEDSKKYMLNRRVGRDDLRFKLIHKSLSKRSNTVPDERNGVDLRERLSRHSHGPLKFDSQHVPESRASALVRRIPPARSAEDLRHLDSVRKSYSCNLDGLRHRSPDRLLRTSGGMSPPRIYDDLRHVPSIRSIDVSRPTSFMAKNVDALRTTTLVSKATVPLEAAKTFLRAPPGGTLQKTYVSEEPLAVSNLLHSLGLGKYAIIFQAEEVDMTVLKQMGDNDLKELGIPMGPRKKILLALLPRPRQRHS